MIDSHTHLHLDPAVAAEWVEAARVWITSGLPTSRASAIWSENAGSWSVRGA